MLNRPASRFSHHASPRPAHGRRRSRATELGFTLMELVVCIAILGVVIIPISSAMVVGFRATEDSQAGLTASSNRDLLTEQFTKDVAQVDAAGVSVDPTRTCGSPSDSTLFVSLNRTRLNNGSTVTDRISYFSTGSGREISIVRFACTGVSPTASASATGTVVARDLGVQGSNRDNVVMAIYSTQQLPNGSFVGRVPCTEFQCGFEIDGRYKIQVTAQRRLFGAGVPVEAGKVYSSSETRRVNVYGEGGTPAVAYDLYGTTDATNGVDASGVAINEAEKVGTEAAFSNQLTLPAGLDGPSKMTVRFAVQSMTARSVALPQGASPNDCSSGQCRFLTAAGGTFTATQKTWINGDYSTGVWRLPLIVGAGDVAKYGGEYRIYTELTPVGQPTKEYGGTNGFPFWIDWRPTNSVFVKQNGTGDGLTPQNPTGSVATGLVQASVSQYNRPNIVVANGSYVEQLDLYGSSLAANDGTGSASNNRTITGGHNGNWLRGAAVMGDPATSTGISGGAADTTQIKSPANTTWVMKVNKRTGLHFRQIGFNNGATSGLAAGTSTYGVIISGNSWVKFENSSVRSGNAAAGANGATPAPALDGCRGNNGAQKNDQPVTGRTAAPGHTTTYNGSNYNVGSATCLFRNSTSDPRTSGNGGNGGDGGPIHAYGGGNGQSGGGSPAGAGGSGGGGGFCDAKPGQAGFASISSLGGSGGAAAGDRPRPTGLWTGPAAATPGTAGVAGRGGGGAGGGGANTCFFVNSDGASGGAGGEGGVQGGAGAAGGNGGGSFALYIYENSTALVTGIRGSIVKAGNGGAGGLGGAGGQGGYGGPGGFGAFNGWQGEDSGGGAGGGLSLIHI